MKKIPLKLALKRETLRTLATNSLALVAGGADSDTFTGLETGCITKIKVTDPER